jgi:uncharacterized protein YggT (Ycf19 family)
MTEIIREKTIVSERVPEAYVFLGRVVFYLTDVIEILLGVRFIMKALGANAGNIFTGTLYGITDRLLYPFRNAFPPGAAGGYVIEWSALLGMLAYLVLALLIVRLLRILFVR